MESFIKNSESFIKFCNMFNLDYTQEEINEINREEKENEKNGKNEGAVSIK